MLPHHHFVCPAGRFFVALTVTLCVLHHDSVMLTVILYDLHNGILCTYSDLWALIMSLFINKTNEWHHINSVWPSQWLGMPLQCICLTFTLTYMRTQWFFCSFTRTLWLPNIDLYALTMTLAFFTLTLYDLHSNSLWGSQDLLLCSHNSKCYHNEYVWSLL